MISIIDYLYFHKLQIMSFKTVNLNWQSFSSNFARFSKELLCDDKLADVTLVSEDLIQYQAHKIILCSCSELFRSLLVNNPHPNPMLYLKGRAENI